MNQSSTKTQAIEHVLTFDAEDWHQGFVHRGISGWEQVGSSERATIDRILRILDEHDTKATFFVLGKFAEAHPALVKLIYAQGHEIASHSYAHVPISVLGIDGFRNDLEQSTDVIQQVTGERVRGYRAPFFSMTTHTLWAYEILAGSGFQYDSSVFPTRIHRYGSPSSLPHPHRVQLKSGASILEFPAQVLRIGPVRMPAAGGFYLRAFPLVFSQWALSQAARKGHVGMVYLHPYDLEPQVPLLKTSLQFRVIRYYNLDKTQHVLGALLQRFRFGAVRDLIGEFGRTFPSYTYPGNP